MDTYKTVKRMELAGIPENYAEVITAVINEATNQSDLVTRSDLKEFRHEIHFEMKSLEQRMTNKVGAIVIGTASVMMFLDKYLAYF